MQLYTNYALVTGIAPEICADTFNRQSSVGKAIVQGDFIHFTLSQTELQNTLATIASAYQPAPPALPDEVVKYLQYVITELIKTYPTAGTAKPYTQEEQDLAILLIYMAQRSENKQKRQQELAARIAAFLKNILFSKISADTQLLLRAAHVMLQPTY